VNVASVSYDPAATLKRFADAHHVEYPMLSDKGSTVIRKFGILNTNIPEGHPFYGIPFPGDYVLAPDGTVRDKAFLPDYQTRPTASDVVLKDFGAAQGKALSIKSGDLQAIVTLSSDHASSGQELGVAVDFAVGPGWHVYGEPLPEGYIPTTVAFEPDLLASQSWDFPKAPPVEFAAIGEKLPAYHGQFRALGKIVIKPRVDPGTHQLKGAIRFQECNDNICKIPQTVAFELPLRIEPFVGATKP
jgi:AhpC/TSA family protein/cytochrome c biogenesis DsbD-like protein